MISAPNDESDPDLSSLCAAFALSLRHFLLLISIRDIVRTCAPATTIASAAPVAVIALTFSDKDFWSGFLTLAGGTLAAALFCWAICASVVDSTSRHAPVAAPVGKSFSAGAGREAGLFANESRPRDRSEILIVQRPPHLLSRRGDATMTMCRDMMSAQRIAVSARLDKNRYLPKGRFCSNGKSSPIFRVQFGPSGRMQVLTARKGL